MDVSDTRFDGLTEILLCLLDQPVDTLAEGGRREIRLGHEKASTFRCGYPVAVAQIDADDLKPSSHGFNLHVPRLRDLLADAGRQPAYEVRSPGRQHVANDVAGRHMFGVRQRGRCVDERATFSLAPR